MSVCFKQISFLAEFTAGNIQNNPHQKAKIDLFMEPGSRALKSGSGSGAGVGTGTGNPGTAIHLNIDGTLHGKTVLSTRIRHWYRRRTQLAHKARLY